MSDKCAAAMVEGLFQKTGAQICVAVTGIAGPGGGTIEKPVGTVYIAYRFDKKPLQVKHFVFPQGRVIFKEKVAQTVFSFLLSL